MRRHTNVLCMLTTKTFAHGNNKTLNICISLFGRCQTLTFMECDPRLHQAMKYCIRVLFVVRRYASGERINNCSVFRQNTYFYDGFRRNLLGQNVRIDRGIISYFQEICDLYICVTCQSPYFPETMTFTFVV